MDFTSNDRERPAEFTELREPWVAFSNAIIRYACDDYKTALGEGRQKIERFIRSTFFSNITSINPDWLIRTLKETFRPRIW